MAAGKKHNWWKAGRGKVGQLKPLMGSWTCETESPMGMITVTRSFTPILDGKFVSLNVEWRYADTSRSPYCEAAVMGPNSTGHLSFWSFTNDGKRSEGWMSAAEDIHPQALCFEADMDAGRARQVYWPHEDGDRLNWCVESQTKKGWNRFVLHTYERTRETAGK